MDFRLNDARTVDMSCFMRPKTPSFSLISLEVKLSEYKIEMPKTVPAGGTTFKVSNTGKEMHNFEIEGNGIEKRVGKLNPGETKTLLVELKPGKYEVYCPVPGHKSHGMSLDLTVR